MSTERDELARIIAERYHAAHDGVTVLDSAIADAILAAGYVKPRQVTTVEELDALPAGTIVRDSKGFAWQKYRRPISNNPAWFPATRDDGFFLSKNFIDNERVRLTVLHVGGES